MLNPLNKLRAYAKKAVPASLNPGTSQPPAARIRRFLAAEFEIDVCNS